MAQIREVKRSIRLYNKAFQILKKGITHQVISKMATSLELNFLQTELLGRAHAMCWASVELYITTLKALASKEPTPSSAAKQSVALLHFMSQYFEFHGSDMGHGKIIAATDHIVKAYDILQQVNFDIPEEVDDFIQALENEVFPTASPTTISMLQYLITHLKRKYEGARNTTTAWQEFRTAFAQVDINSVEDLYNLVQRYGALPVPQN